MRKILLLLCSLLMTAAEPVKLWSEAVPGSWGPPTDGWLFAIFSEKQTVFSGEPLSVVLVVRNLSSQAHRISLSTSKWKTADFAIKRIDDHHVINLRPEDRLERLRRNANDKHSVQVEPGAIVRQVPVNLADMFDLQPGTYTVQASWKLPKQADPKAEITVESNQITVTVIGR